MKNTIILHFFKTIRILGLVAVTVHAVTFSVILHYTLKLTAISIIY